MKIIIKIWHKLLKVFARGNSVYYISGADILPPPLTQKEEADYIESMCNGDEKAREILIERNLRIRESMLKI